MEYTIDQIKATNEFMDKSKGEGDYCIDTELFMQEYNKFTEKYPSLVEWFKRYNQEK